MSSQLLNNIDIEIIAEALNNIGYIVIQDVLSEDFQQLLQQRINTLTTNELQDAKLGRANQSKEIKEIRSDKTYWLDELHAVDQQYIAYMENIRIQLNQSLYLGLFEYECHYAVYSAGSFYTKHSDVLAGNNQNDNVHADKNRILSSVYYLNKNWQQDDGGELILYDKNDDSTIDTIYPENNKLVLFLSEQLPHEVKTTNRTRYSITGWFRVNNQSPL